MIHVVILGDSMVGKTSLFNRITQTHEFGDTFCTTIIPIYGLYKHYFFYDTPGKKRWNTYLKPYLKIADGAIIMYDVTKGKETIQKWKSILLEENRKNIPIQIVGNKIDLCNCEKEIDTIYLSCKENDKIYEKLNIFLSTLRPNPKISIGWMDYFLLLVEDATDQMLKYLFE